MADIYSPEKRSEIMSKVRDRDTGPERSVRSIIHRLGYRFRLHCRYLPGHPDITLPGRRKAIFVHGCFWHSHKGCKRATVPSTRQEWWETKLERTKQRDEQACDALKQKDWVPIVVWECELRDIEVLKKKLRRCLN